MILIIIEHTQPHCLKLLIKAVQCETSNHKHNELDRKGHKPQTNKSVKRSENIYILVDSHNNGLQTSDPI